MLNTSHAWHRAASRWEATVAALAVLVAATGGVSSGHAVSNRRGALQQGSPAPAPAQVIARWGMLIGTWVADNSRYKSDRDTMDAYGIQWSWGLNKKSLVGRLYGIKAGKEVGAFWEFREIWHPAERTLIAMQFGSDGTYGVGPNRLAPDGSTELLQTFYHPEEQITTKVGHRGRLEGDVHTTMSYDVDDQGIWKDRRTYVWRRQREGRR